MSLAIRIFLFRFFLWTVALGCLVSGAASGRFFIRLVADGAIACVFVPVFSIAACALVLPRKMRLLDAIGAFLDGNGPWLVWLTLATAVFSIVPPRSIGPWILPIEISLVIPLLCCLGIDLRFFRETIGRTTRQAWRDLATQRLLSWSGIVVYFLGIAIWGEVVPKIAGVGRMVTPTKLIACGLVSAGLLAGTLADRVPERPPLTLDGHRVLAADFHIHSATWSDGGLTPWGLVLEARRQGLDAIAVTGHNQVSDAKVARWFSRWIGGPTVLVGQEVLGPEHHVIAVGIEHVVDSTLPVAQQVAAIHAQGGVAIAAHPLPRFWPSFDSEALATLDGAEICHPLVYNGGTYQRDLEAFRQRGHFAAIGSSDFHGFGRMGMCRTFVFARVAGPDAVIDAIRDRQTVVYSPGGKASGDPGLIQLAETHPELRAVATTDASASVLDWLSRVGVLVGLLVLSVTGRGK